MKMNKNNIFLLTLIVGNYIYSDIADLEKQIAHQILRDNAILTNLAALNIIKDPEHSFVWMKLGAHVNDFNPNFDKKILDKYNKMQDAAEVQAQVKQELQGLTRSELLSAMIASTNKNISLKKELFTEYKTYNKQLSSKSALSAAALCSCCLVGNGIYMNLKNSSINPIALSIAQISVINLGILLITCLNAKPVDALQESINSSINRVCNLQKEVTQSTQKEQGDYHENQQ